MCVSVCGSTGCAVQKVVESLIWWNESLVQSDLVFSISIPSYPIHSYPTRRFVCFSGFILGNVVEILFGLKVVSFISCHFRLKCKMALDTIRMEKLRGTKPAARTKEQKDRIYAGKFSFFCISFAYWISSAAYGVRLFGTILESFESVRYPFLAKRMKAKENFYFVYSLLWKQFKLCFPLSLSLVDSFRD